MQLLQTFREEGEEGVRLHLLTNGAGALYGGGACIPAEFVIVSFAMRNYLAKSNRRKLPVALAFVALFGLLACQSSRVINSTDRAQETSGAPNLTLAEASLRYGQIKNISYHLFLDLTQPNSFSGREEIGFDWNGSREDLRLDFEHGEILELKINGELRHFNYNGQFIQLANADLKTGHNQIQFTYSHAYSDIGGLIRFVDPEDQKVYLHSKFEPYFANRMFPCFDQPDLKATYTLTVRAPEDWVVIGPTLEQKKEPDTQETARWSFPETPPFSTYLFSG
jgi:aminopeptidase N